jgi:5-methylcytosine-specific restriction endonuclease McrA
LKIWSTLKLDSSYRPIQVISALEAFAMVYTGRAQLIEAYANEYFHSVSDNFPIPSIIVVCKYVRKTKFRLRCNRRNVFWRDRYRCQYCGIVNEGKVMTLDHVIPRSRGGMKVWQNVVTCCHPCNQRKGDMLLNECGMVLQRAPALPSPYMFRTLDRASTPQSWIPYLPRKRKQGTPDHSPINEFNNAN